MDYLYSFCSQPGSMPLINTWDVLIYAPITLLFGSLILWRNRDFIRSGFSWLYLVTIPPLAILCYIPFYLELQTHSGGVGLVTCNIVIQRPLSSFWSTDFSSRSLLHSSRGILLNAPITSLQCALSPYRYFSAAVAVVPLVYLVALKKTDF